LALTYCQATVLAESESAQGAMAGQADLDGFVGFYNEQRSRQGYRGQGGSPRRPFGTE